LGLINLFNKKGEKETKSNSSAEDIDILKQRFSQLAQKSPLVENESKQPEEIKDIPKETKDLPKESINVVEVEGEKETIKQVPLKESEIDNSEFEEVILSQGKEALSEQIEKKKEEEINKKSIANYLDEIKESYEDAKLISLVIKQVKELIEIDNGLSNKIKEIEVTIKNEITEREKVSKQIDTLQKQIKSVEKNMDKFVALYEMVTNQFNPFIEKNDNPAVSIPSPNVGLSLPKADFKDEKVEEEPEKKEESLSAAQDLFRRLRAQKESVKTKSNSSPSEDKKEIDSKNEINIDNKESMTPEEIINKIQNKQDSNNPSQDNFNSFVASDSATSNPPNAVNSPTPSPSVSNPSNAVNSPTPSPSVSNLSNAVNSPAPSPSVSNPPNIVNPESSSVNSANIGQIKQTKILPEHLHMVLKDGTRINSLSSLLEFLNENDDYTIGEYVTHYKNEFSGWVYETFHNEMLSKKLADCKSRVELIMVLSDYINTHH
jgi:hypothetical protein